MKSFRTGLVVGKFAPLHLGHEHTIRTALQHCDHVVILSYSRPEFPGYGPSRRAEWLACRFPETTRIVLSHPSEPIPNNTESDLTHRAFCATVLQRKIDLPIDAIFSSEAYGLGFAENLAKRQGSPVAHISVDQARTMVPISGTALRADIHGLRHFMSPEVYASFIERVAFLGGESTGKSTLAAALAEDFKTSHVSEYGRELWDLKNGRLAFEDMLAIAREQVRREEAALLENGTHRFLFCDTTPLTTLFYSREMFGRAAPELTQLAGRSYHHLFLCDDDFPFSQDGTRRDSGFRAKGQDWYREQLRELPHQSLHGPLRSRMAQVRSWICD
ncbi:AAA family ATPase [Haloferula sp.]|uniref:AAA family ATPase n=1 Tax=Haloferula sp. TaxID=2497595 RepID=UPI003C77A5E6